jgi:class 3 adenylate cyclase
MHREFRRLINEASGKLEHILAIIVDIRGFSSFSQKNESYDVAEYLKEMYVKMIDNYFSEASFFKPLGDGLLIVFTCPPKGLEGFLQEHVKRCLSLTENFKTLCCDNPRINFEAPNNIGIGLSRGSACKLSAKNKTLDYFGRVINLAARLNDMARPSGIVFDSNLGFSLLGEDIKKRFTKDSVYIRGISESQPICVYFTKELTIINPLFKKPLNEPKWKTSAINYKYSELKNNKAKTLSLELTEEPLDIEQTTLRIIYSRKDSTDFNCFDLNIHSKGVSYKEVGPLRYVAVMYDVLIEELARLELADDSVIEFKVIFPAKA